MNLEAEEALLGCLLLDPAVADAVEHLKPEDFYVLKHRQLFDAAMTIHAAGRPVTLTGVSAWLEDLGQLEPAGGRAWLTQLVEGVFSSAVAADLAKIVREKAERRETIQAAVGLIQAARDPTVAIQEVRSAADAMALRQAETAGGESLRHIAAVAPAFLMGMESSRLHGATGIPTGFYDYDSLTGGLHPGELVILAARPAMGKTAMALQVALAVAQKQARPVLIFSLEMGDQQLLSRMVSCLSGVTSTRIRGGMLDRPSMQALGEAVNLIAHQRIFIDDQPILGLGRLRAAVKATAARHGRPAAVLIDYLQLMEGEAADRNGGRVMELSRITRGLKLLAREVEVPVVALSQLSRAVEQRTNKRPMLSDLRESGSIEQDADLVAMLYRDEYYNPETTDRGIAELIITKHRNGPVGTVKLLFEQQSTRFRNCATI